MKAIILYHGLCADGFCAAWVAHRALGDGADYLAVNYGEPPPDVTGREVYILDFSFKRPVMLDIARAAKSVVVLDHHKTAAAELANLSRECAEKDLPITTVIFDMEHSGGRLTWDYFFGNEYAKKYTPESCEEIRPWLVNYTEDRDLWLWKLPTSREVSAALTSLPWDFTAWDLLNQANRLDIMATDGAAILRYQQQQIDNAVKNAHEIELDGHKVLCLNSTTLISEITGKLAEGRPFGATWFEKADGSRVWSLRSRDGGVDVSEIAKKRGGGGHRNAAGYQS